MLDDEGGGGRGRSVEVESGFGFEGKYSGLECEAGVVKGLWDDGSGD